MKILANEKESFTIQLSEREFALLLDVNPLWPGFTVTRKKEAIKGVSVCNFQAGDEVGERVGEDLQSHHATASTPAKSDELKRCGRKVEYELLKLNKLLTDIGGQT